MVAIGFTSMLKGTMRSERGIASNADLTQTQNTIDLILETRSSCTKSGLIGMTVDPANPDANPVTLHIPGTTGVGAVAVGEGESVGTRNVSRLRFAALAPLEPVAGGMLYFATLRLETAVRGQALTHRNPNRDIYLKVVLDASNHIIDCYQHAGPSVMDCVRNTDTSSWSLGSSLTVGCPTGYHGTSCVTDYLDNNGGGVYHGFSLGTWDATRSTCSATCNDGGITWGRITVECCRLP